MIYKNNSTGAVLALERQRLGDPEDEPRAIKRCSWCDSGIYEEDRFVDIDGEIFCEDCIWDMPREMLLNKCGYYFETAMPEEDEEEYDGEF